MGADIALCDPHRAIVTGPAPAARRARRVARHPRRHGDADRRAVRRGPQRDRQHPPDRPRLRAHRRAPARARRADRARRDRAASTPSLGDYGRDPPDPQRHARRPARRDARAARDHRARCAASSSAHGYGEVYTPALEYEDVLRRGRRRRAAGLPRVRRPRRGARAARRT